MSVADGARLPDDEVDPIPSAAEPASAGEKLAADVLEIVEALRHLASAKLDRARLRLRRVAISVLLLAVAGVCGLTLVVGLLWLTLRGLAGAISHASGGADWIGELIVGSGGLALIALGGWAGLALLERKAKLRTVTKYESRKLKQRYAFGQDVEDASAAADGRHETGSQN